MTLLPSVGSPASDFPLRNRRASSSTWSWLFMAMAALILTGRDGVAALEMASPTVPNLWSPLTATKSCAASCLGYTCDDSHWVQLQREHPMHNYDCKSLESYGCDCTGCECDGAYPAS